MNTYEELRRCYERGERPTLPTDIHLFINLYETIVNSDIELARWILGHYFPESSMEISFYNCVVCKNWDAVRWFINGMTITDGDFERISDIRSRVIKSLIQRYGSSPIWGDLIHYLVRKTHESRDSIVLLKIILSSGCNVNIYDKWGRTPLYIASMFAPSGVIRLLLECGADPYLKNKVSGISSEESSIEFTRSMLDPDDLHMRRAAKEVLKIFSDHQERRKSITLYECLAKDIF